MSGKAVHKGGRGNRILSKVCHACHKTLGETLFGVGMWRGDRHNRRCRDCVDAKRLCGAAGADAAHPEELSQPLSPAPSGPLDQVQHCHAGDGEDDDLFDEDEPAHGQQLLPIVSTTPNTVEPLVPMPPAAASPPPARNRTVRSKLDPDQP